MTGLNTWSEAASVLEKMKTKYSLTILEIWALDYSVRCIQRDRKIRCGQSMTEQAIQATEEGLRNVYESSGEAVDTSIEEHYLDIESRR